MWNYVKMLKRCQMSKSETQRLWTKLTKKNWYKEVHIYLTSIFYLKYEVYKIVQNTFYPNVNGFLLP